MRHYDPMTPLAIRYVHELRQLAEIIEALNALEATPPTAMPEIEAMATGIPCATFKDLPGSTFLSGAYFSMWPHIRAKAIHDASVQVALQHEEVAKAAARIGIAPFIATLHAAQKEEPKPPVTCSICQKPIEDGTAVQQGGFGMQVMTIHAACAPMRPGMGARKAPADPE